MIRFLANNTGSLFSSKSISDFLKNQKVNISANQVSEYADSLSEAFVVHRINRYDIGGKRLFERGEKYFFENMGIRNVIAGYKPQDKAKRLENLVCNHLLYRGYDVKVGSLATEEIDFVCTKGGETLYVQVAMELTMPDTIAREFGNLLKIKDNDSHVANIRKTTQISQFGIFFIAMLYRLTVPRLYTHSLPVVSSLV